MRHQIGVALAAACMALLVSGCGGTHRTQSMDSGAAAPAPERAAAATARPQAKQSRQSEARAATGENVASGVQVARQDRQVIYTASMTVRAKDVTVAAQRAKQVVTTAGGYLAREESTSAEDSRASALLEFKIPPARYAEVMGTLGKDLGRQLRLEQGTQDVTLRVADVDSRLKSAQQALDSLRTLLKRADTIGQVLQVEREIAGREADLESLQAQQKELAAQVGMATLALRLVGPAAVVSEPSEEPAGFLGGLKAGWTSLVDFLKIMLTVLGAVLPWLAVTLPALALVTVLLRRYRRTRPSLPAAPPAASAPAGGQPS